MENTEVVSIESSDLKSILDRLDSLEAKPKKRKWRSIGEGAVAGVDYQPSGMDLVDAQTHGEMVDAQQATSDAEYLNQKVDAKLRFMGFDFRAKMPAKSKRSSRILYIEDDIIEELQAISPFNLTPQEKIRQIISHFVASHEDPTEL